MNYNTNGDYKFDLDLQKGQHFENELLKIITSGDKWRVEVKADRRVSDTGSLAIEYKCRGKYSGISTTEAEWYAFVLGGEAYNDEVIVMITTERLKRIVKKVWKMYKTKTMGGDENLSEMILINVGQLLTTNLRKK